MAMSITDAFDLPRPEDIRAMGFVIRLRDAAPDSHEVGQLVDDYVITPAVARELPRILDDMKQVFDRGEEYGRFVHGSFGSGKSHLMTMIALLLEDTAPAWDKFGPLLDAHRSALADAGREAPDHRAWLPEANLLVVRIHMLSVRGRDTGLDRAVYDAFNAALKRRGKQTFEFLNVAAVLEEVRREADAYGDIVWKRLETAGILGGKADFEALADASAKSREAFARAWLDYKGRDPIQAGVDPRWSDGIRRMGEHAKAQGFGGVVLMIDEFLLWLAEKSGSEFIREINNLNVIVDHNTGQRPAPMFVFVARQRNLQEFFPDLVDESKIHEHLDHHAKRFELTRLQDVELRHIVRGRVLRPKDAAAVQQAVAALSDTQQKVLPALLAGSDIEYLRDVYPFHPALIEMLVDVTALMQRERSALRLLYELLVLHYPDLPLGQLMPVGSAFAAIFPPSGVEASKKVELMQDIHQQYYTRLAPALQLMLEDASTDFDAERRRALDQMVKTALLAEVSPRLKQGGLTVERLVQLNAVDVEGETFRGRVRVAEADLLALSQYVPDLQVAGQGKTAVVRYVLGRVSLGEILNRARSKVDNNQQRFRVFWAALKQALGITGLKGFEEGGPNDGDWDLTWRRTRRRGRLKLCNVRDLSYDDFEPPGAFSVLVDYPWDKPGHTVDEDRLRATNARKNRGALHTVCWLPRHLSPRELDVLIDLAAVRYLLSDAGQEELLETLGPQDRAKVLDMAGVRANTLAGQLDELLREVYVQHGELYALMSDVDGSRPRETLAENLTHIATTLMDRRYPQHPHFLAEPKKADLETLLDWMVRAGEANVSVAYDEQTGKVLRNLGQPLELVNLGQTKASLRFDSRYIKDVLQRTDADSVSWAPIAEHLRDTYGLQPAVIDLFLCFLCQRDHRALREVDGDAVEVKIGMPQSVPIRLQRGTLLATADWHRVRELGNDLFALPRPAAHRSLKAQDRFAASLAEHGREQRKRLQGLHERLVGLGVEGSERAKAIASANAQLAPLAQSTTDSHQVLTALLAAWPDGGADALRAVVRNVQATESALDALSTTARGNLLAAKGQGELGAEVQAHLSALHARLSATDAELPLNRDWVEQWNGAAQGLIQRLLAQSAGHAAPEDDGPGEDGKEPDGTPNPHTEKSTPQSASTAWVHSPHMLCEGRVHTRDPATVEAFVAEVERALASLGDEHVKVALVRVEADAK